MSSIREHAWTAMHKFEFTKEEWLREMDKAWDYVESTGDRCKPRDYDG